MFWKNKDTTHYPTKDTAGYGGYLVLILFFFSTCSATASFPDTLQVKKNDLLLFNDSLVAFEKDTVIIIPHGTAVFRIRGNYDKSQMMYDSLHVKASRKKWANRLYHLFFTSAGSGTVPEISSSMAEYRKFEGKIIREIRYYRLDPFGTIIRDTVLLPPKKGSSSFLNKLHVTTRWQTVRKNLMFHTGDRVSPQLFDDNERLLRHLPYIRDARFLLLPVGNDMVDVLVVTRDVFSIGASLDYRGINAGGVSVLDKNFLGRGHEIRGGVLYDFRENDPVGGYGRYKVNNLWGSFISGDIRMISAFSSQQYTASFERPFLSQFMKNNGGLEGKYIFTHDLLEGDTLELPIRYSSYDGWYARSILLDTEKRRRIVFSGRYHFNNISKRPELEEDEYYKYQEYQLFLGQVTLSSDRYYKTSLIYNYGTTEDIPEGVRIGLTGGYELNEFINRFYLGTEITAGKYFPHFGYINAGVSAGGFHPQGRNTIKQGVLNIYTDYFSPLFAIGRLYYRQFINIGFTTGVNRYSDELLIFNDKFGIRGLRSDSLTGIRRFAVKTETVAFSPFYFYGFRFVFFAFADLGILDLAEKPLTYSKLYSGFGLGLRIRNENLIFNTFQIRFAYYPVLPTEARYQTIVISGEKNYSPYDFIPHKPEIVDFR